MGDKESYKLKRGTITRSYKFGLLEEILCFQVRHS